MGHEENNYRLGGSDGVPLSNDRRGPSLAKPGARSRDDQRAGLEGRIEITDKEVLAALKLGVFEGLEGPQLEAPPVNRETYTIRRWFYGGEFNFATLHYYLDPAGGNGYVLWDDGPDLTGDHTEYNGQWLRVTPKGEAAMRKLLLGLGISLAVKPQPPSTANTQSISAAAAEPFLIGGLALIVVVSGLLIWRGGAARSTAARHTD